MTILYGTKLNSFSWPEGCSARIALYKITQDVRDYAAKQGISEDEALKEGMKHQAVRFKEGGAEIYKEV